MRTIILVAMLTYRKPGKKAGSFLARTTGFRFLERPAAVWRELPAKQFKLKRVELLPDHPQKERQQVELLPDRQRLEHWQLGVLLPDRQRLEH